MSTSSCASARLDLFERARRGAGGEELERHLAVCSQCRALSQHLEGMVSAWREEVREIAEPVELARVHAGVRATWRDRPRRSVDLRWFGFIGAAVAAIALAVLRPVLWPEPPREYAPDALALLADSASRVTDGMLAPLAPNAAIRNGDAVQVARGGRLLVSLGPQRLFGGPETSLRFHGTHPRRVSVTLDHGRIVGQVERVNGQAPEFTVTWPGGEVIVTGTVFEVTVDPAQVEVSVARGKVKVRSQADGTWHEVSAGSSLVLRAGDGTVERRDLLATEREALLDAITAYPPAAAASPPTEAGTGRPRQTPLAPRRAHDERETPSQTPRESARDGQCEAAARQLQDAGLRAEARGTALVDVGDCYRARDDIDNAITWYARAASEAPHTPAGENAAFELGRIFVEHGRRNEADEAFGRYLTSYPRGTFADDALFARCSLAVEAQRADDALGCLATYRQRFPKSRRLRDAFLLEATVLRVSKKDCVAASRAYEIYLQDPGTFAHEAESWKKWCERDSGTRNGQ